MAKGQTRESVKMAIDTLRANKLRSGLTILGIVIGVSTVITISSVISGVNNRVNDWVSSLGSNVIWVFHMPVIGVRPTAEMLARKLGLRRRRRISPSSVYARSSTSVRADTSPGRSARPAADSVTIWCCWLMSVRPSPFRTGPTAARAWCTNFATMGLPSAADASPG